MTTETIVDRFSSERIPVRALTAVEQHDTAVNMRKKVFYDLLMDKDIRESMTAAMLEWLTRQSEIIQFEMANYIGGIEG